MKRVAVIGFGFMGMTHTLNILKNADLQLVAIVDKYPETIEKNFLAKSVNISTGNIDPSVLKNITKYSNLTIALRTKNLMLFIFVFIQNYILK